MLTLVVVLSLILIPFFCVGGWDDGIRAPKEILSIISFIAIIFTAFRFYRIRPFKNIWLLLFGGWCFFTLVLSNYNINIYLEKITLGFPSNYIAFKSLLYITLAITTIVCMSGAKRDQANPLVFGGAKICYKETHDTFNIPLITKVISFVCLVLCGMALLQIIGIDEWFRVADPSTGWVGKCIWDKNPGFNQFGNISHRTVATIGNPALLGIFLAMLSVFPLSLKKIYGYFIYVFSIAIIWMTGSTTAIAALVASTMFYFYFTNKKLLLISVIAMLMLLPFGYKKLENHFKYSLNPSGRVSVLKETWNELYKKPITGYGLGSFEYRIGGNPEIVKRLNNQNWKEAHNEFVQCWYEVGLIGLILFMMFIITSFSNMNNPILGASLAAFLIACINYFPIRVAPLSFYGVILTGLFLNKGDE